MARLKWRFVTAAVLAVAGLTTPGTGLQAEPPTSVTTAPTGSKPARASAPDTPFAFEPNHGQFDPQVRFASRGRGYTLFLTESEAVIAASSSSPITLTLKDARRAAAVGVDPQPGTVNYLIGNDPAKWHTGIVTYERVQYESVYPGIDLVYYGRDGVHEYDFIVDAGADPTSIAMQINGAERLELDGHTGNLRLVAAGGAFTMRSPDVYQIVNGQRETIAAHYVLGDKSSVSFDVGTYDAAAPLVIDPQLIYGTFLGGTGNGLDQVTGLALGRDGSPFIVGSTDTSDFPVRGPLQPRPGGLADAVVTKLSPDGLQRVYATYIGGSSYDGAADIAVRSNGTAYIVGSTLSDDFPVRASAFQPRRAGGSDVFLLALAADGASISESTLLGGSDEDSPVGLELALFRNPHPGASVPKLGVGDWIFVYGATNSPQFPTIGAAQANRVGTRDAFVTVFDRRTLQPLYSTYVGLEGENLPTGLTVNRRTGQLFLFIYRSDNVGPWMARLTPFVTNRGSRIGPLYDGDLGWKIWQIRNMVEGLKSRLGPSASTGALEELVEKLRAQLKNGEPLPCGDFDDADFPLDDPGPIDPADDYPLPDPPDFPLPDINDDPFVDPLPEPAPPPDDPFPTEDLVGEFCDGRGESLGFRVPRQTLGSQAVGAATMVTADQLAKTVTMLVMPGCFPVPPSTTCNERAVLVFFDKKLDAIAHLNFGGQRAGREFIPTASSLDAWGRLHMIGTTSDNNLPVVSPVQGSARGSSEGFVLTLNPSTGDTKFFSYLGGSSFDTLVDIAVDRRGNRWIAGTTLSQDFPVTRSGVQPDIAGRIDGFIVKIVP